MDSCWRGCKTGVRPPQLPCADLQADLALVTGWSPPCAVVIEQLLLSAELEKDVSRVHAPASLVSFAEPISFAGLRCDARHPESRNTPVLLRVACQPRREPERLERFVQRRHRLRTFRSLPFPRRSRRQRYAARRGDAEGCDLGLRQEQGAVSAIAGGLGCPRAAGGRQLVRRFSPCPHAIHTDDSSFPRSGYGRALSPREILDGSTEAPAWSEGLHHTVAAAEGLSLTAVP